MKIGIIGVSSKFAYVVKLCSQNSKLQLVGYTSSTNKPIQDLLAEEKHFTEPSELISQVNTLIWLDSTTSTNELKLQLAKGKALFVYHTKNLTSTDIETLASTAQEANVLCMLNFGLKYYSGFDVLKGHESPLFIELSNEYFYDEDRIRSQQIVDLMLENLDLIRSLESSELKRVFATGVKVSREEVGIANARLEFANGCVANLTVNRIGMMNSHYLKIYYHDFYYLFNITEKKIDKIYFIHHDTKSKSTDLVAAIAEDRNGIIAMEHIPITDSPTSEEALNTFLENSIKGKVDNKNLHESKWVLNTAARISKKINFLGDE